MTDIEEIRTSNTEDGDWRSKEMKFESRLFSWMIIRFKESGDMIIMS
jgi:hypothetical protein